MAKEKIPCLDLTAQHQTLKKELFEIWQSVYDQCAFSGGAFVSDFENAFAEFCGSKYAAGVSNGTTALHLALLAAGIKSGDEVIVPGLYALSPRPHPEIL